MNGMEREVAVVIEPSGSVTVCSSGHYDIPLPEQRF